MTTEELVTKFRRNAEDVLSSTATDDVIDTLLNLERARDFSAVMGKFHKPVTMRIAS